MNPVALPDYSLTQPHGRPSGVTVCLLHGAFGAKDYWRDQVAALVAAGHRVLAWDAPGYGLSALPPDFGIEHCAQALTRLLREQGGACNVLLGHSMGGMIAQRAWVHAPELIQGYVLSATSAAFGQPDGNWQREFVRQRVAPLDAGKSLPEHAPDMLRAMMAPGSAGPAIERLIATVSQMREATFRAAVSAIASYEGRALLPTMNIPVLCVAGALDRTAPAEVMAKMASKLPQAQLVVLPDVGHFGWAEDAPAFNRTLLEFLSDHFPERSAA